MRDLTLEYQPISQQNSSLESPAKRTALTHRRFTLLGLFCCLCFVLAYLGRLSGMASMGEFYHFEVVNGFFDLPLDTFNTSHFGLKSRDWSQFQADIANLQSDRSAEYKVFFLARHGQGVHNVAESLYGTVYWDCKWAMLEGNGDLVWGPDPELTELGRQQAETAHRGWQRELQENKAPMPELFISSPFTRAADTARITWDGLSEQPHIFKEQFRETIGLHTCDKRNNRSWLAKRFPNFKFDNDFAEEDLLWTKDEQEHDLAQTYRLYKAMERIFAEEKSATYVALSAHSGAIRHILEAVNHPPYTLATGGMVPIVVGAVKTENSIAKPVYDPVRAPACPRED